MYSRGRLIDATFGAVYYRRLLRTAPVTEEFGDRLVDQVLGGVRSRAAVQPFEWSKYRFRQMCCLSGVEH